MSSVVTVHLVEDGTNLTTCTGEEYEQHQNEHTHGNKLRLCARCLRLCLRGPD